MPEILIDLSMVPKHLDHYVCLNSEAMSDIEWWVCVMRKIGMAAPRS